MSTQITTAFVEQYRSAVEHLFQQDGSRLGDKVRRETQHGKTEFFEQLGATSAVRRTARHADTPRVNSNHQRRACYLNDYEWSDLIDQQDKIRLLIDAQSAYLQSAKMAMDRGTDDEIIAAFFATAYADTGSGNGSVSAVTFPTSTATNVIPVNYIPTAPAGSGANTGLTLGKLLRMKSLLTKAEPPKGSKMYIGTPQQGIDDLLNNVTQVSSADYASVKALVDGEINRFAGLDFVRGERFTYASGTDLWTIPAWIESAMLLSTGAEFETRVSERSDKSYSVQAYAKKTMGSTRMQEAGVVSCVLDASP